MKQNLLTGWNVQRIVMLILGTAICTQSIIGREWLGLLPGVYLAAMGILGFGCASGNCEVQHHEINRHLKKVQENKANKA